MACQAPRGKPFEKPYQLFNLAADIEESEDRISEETNRATELEARFRSIYEADR